MLLIIAWFLIWNFDSGDEAKWSKPGHYIRPGSHRWQVIVENRLSSFGPIGGLISWYHTHRAHVAAMSTIWLVPRGAVEPLLQSKPTLTNESGCAVWVLNGKEGHALLGQIHFLGGETNDNILSSSWYLDDKGAMNNRETEVSAHKGVGFGNGLDIHISPRVEKKAVRYAIEATYQQAQMISWQKGAIPTNLQAAFKISVPFDGMILIKGGAATCDTNLECWLFIRQTVTDSEGRLLNQ
jgi:hypothetical protein